MRPITSINDDIYDLHMTIFWICVAIGIVVFSLLIYSMVTYRKSASHQAKKHATHNTLELVWVVIPSIIVITMAIPATLILMHRDNTHHLSHLMNTTSPEWEKEGKPSRPKQVIFKEAVPPATALEHAHA